MKKVVNTNSVIQLWANQSQTEARNPNRSIFFEGNTIYSYGKHFAIAKHVGSEVLISTRKYSVTTAKHKGGVFRAVCRKNPIFVENVDNSVEDNFIAFRTQLSNLSNKASKARQNRERYIKEITSLINSAERYATLTGVERSKYLSY